MSGIASILRYDGPSVREGLYLFGPGHHHRLYAKGHPRFDGYTASRLSKIGNLWRLVQPVSDAVSGVVSHKTAAGGDHYVFYRKPDVSEGRFRFDRGGAFVQGLKCKVEQPLSLFTYLPHRIGAGRVSEEALD